MLFYHTLGQRGGCEPLKLFHYCFDRTSAWEEGSGKGGRQVTLLFGQQSLTTAYMFLTTSVLVQTWVRGIRASATFCNCGPRRGLRYHLCVGINIVQNHGQIYFLFTDFFASDAMAASSSSMTASMSLATRHSFTLSRILSKVLPPPSTSGRLLTSRPLL